VALAYLAAETRRVRLGTGIIILPQRQPAVLAKQVASLDVLSQGRLILGIGVGYLEPEFRALGVPMTDRGHRADEYLEAMQALWTQEAPAYHGRFVDFEGVDAHPRPVQPAGPPIVVGGRTPAAYRRAVQRANGWYGYYLTPELTAEAIAGLARAGESVHRPEHLGPLEISVTPRVSPDRDAVNRYAELGVDRLILLPPSGLDVDSLAAFVGQNAPAELLA
jgi:probable F420-dependent oxidoreductase